MQTRQRDEALAKLARSIDANGTIVSIEAVDWLVCFVPGLAKEWWHSLVHTKHQHVFAIRETSPNRWLLVESWKHRLHIPLLSESEALPFLQWAAMGDVLQVREDVPGHAWQSRGWANCAVLTALVLGRRSWTWTPQGLYRQLSREANTSRFDMAAFLMMRDAHEREETEASRSASEADPLTGGETCK